MAKNSITKTTTNNSIMEQLLASEQKLTILHRGQELEGKIISISDKEITLDLGAKSEGVIAAREIPADLRSQLQAGSTLKAFVHIVENEHGQTVLSLSAATHLEGARTHFKGSKAVNWSKLAVAHSRQSKLQGKVLEINKGGLIVEVMSIRGFLPNSQVGFELFSKAGEGLDKLIGENLTVTVIEIDQNNNKLIFSQRGPVSSEVKAKLAEFKSGQQTTGKIVAILPFGLVVDVAGAEGLVFISDVSWDRVDDLSKHFTLGQEVSVKVLGQDEELGRLNLSIKHLIEDPFATLAQQFPVDEVVKGEITSTNETGIVVKLVSPSGTESGIEGFLPAAKIVGTNYEVGKTATFLVSGIDTKLRRINLAPFITSTEGLIYK